jgi:hypothetical protein
MAGEDRFPPHLSPFAKVITEVGSGASWAVAGVRSERPDGSTAAVCRRPGESPIMAPISAHRLMLRLFAKGPKAEV